jgi:hypothetical protein
MDHQNWPRAVDKSAMEIFHVNGEVHTNPKKPYVVSCRTNCVYFDAAMIRGHP